MVNDRPSEERRQIENCFTANYQALCYFADSLLHDVEVSEDVVQDVFCKVIGSGRQFESEGHMRSYLYIAVRNSCINLLRSAVHADHMTAANIIDHKNRVMPVTCKMQPDGNVLRTIIPAKTFSLFRF